VNIRVIGVRDLGDEELAECFRVLGYSHPLERAKWCKQNIWQFKASDPVILAHILQRHGVFPSHSQALDFTGTLFRALNYGP
jgi:hypothetical protein